MILKLLITSFHCPSAKFVWAVVREVLGWKFSPVYQGEDLYEIWASHAIEGSVQVLILLRGEILQLRYGVGFGTFAAS
jgi:hypothetical protein